MNQFLHVETKEIVKIMSDEGNFLTLNNGMKIDKQLFTQKYAPMNDQGAPTTPGTINPELFMNTPTNITVKTKQQQQQTVNQTQQTNEQIIAPTDKVDAIDFLESPSNIVVEGLDAIKNMDLSKAYVGTEEERVIIRDLNEEPSAVNTIQQNAPQSMADQKKALLEKHNQMVSNQNIPAYVDENDPNAVNQMMQNFEQPKPVKKVNENGLTKQQEIIREQQIELTGEDPFLDKIRKFRASKGFTIEPVTNPQMMATEELQPENVQQNQQPVQQPVQSQQVQPVQEDPTIALFRKFKRNHKVSINIKIKDQISKPDFIKVMADGLDGDIIQFYTDDLLKTFLSDIGSIKSTIYNQLHKDVFGCLPNELEVDEDDVEIVEEDVIVLIPGKPTKTNKLTFKYINERGNVVDMIPETAEKKNLKPATKKDLKK